MVNKFKQRIGSRAQVIHGIAKMTGGGLKKKDLKYNKQNKIVSRKASNTAKRVNKLVKAGYITRKGIFGVIKKGGMNNVPNYHKNIVNHHITNWRKNNEDNWNNNIIEIESNKLLFTCYWGEILNIEKYIKWFNRLNDYCKEHEIKFIIITSDSIKEQLDKRIPEENVILFKNIDFIKKILNSVQVSFNVKKIFRDPTLNVWLWKDLLQMLVLFYYYFFKSKLVMFIDYKEIITVELLDIFYNKVLIKSDKIFFGNNNIYISGINGIGNKFTKKDGILNLNPLSISLFNLIYYCFLNKYYDYEFYINKNYFYKPISIFNAKQQYKWGYAMRYTGQLGNKIIKFIDFVKVPSVNYNKPGRNVNKAYSFFKQRMIYNRESNKKLKSEALKYDLTIEQLQHFSIKKIFEGEYSKLSGNRPIILTQNEKKYMHYYSKLQHNGNINTVNIELKRPFLKKQKNKLKLQKIYTNYGFPEAAQRIMKKDIYNFNFNNEQCDIKFRGIPLYFNNGKKCTSIGDIILPFDKNRFQEDFRFESIKKILISINNNMGITVDKDDVSFMFYDDKEEPLVCIYSITEMPWTENIKKIVVKKLNEQEKLNQKELKGTYIYRIEK